MEDMWNEVNSLISDQRWHINTLNVKVKHIVLVSGMRGGAANPQTIANEQRRVVLHLSKCRRDLWVLWREREQGLGGGKPAKAFPCAKQGAVKYSFLSQKLLWDTIKGMVRRGQTLDGAIDNIY